MKLRINRPKRESKGFPKRAVGLTAVLLFLFGTAVSFPFNLSLYRPDLNPCEPEEQEKYPGLSVVRDSIPLLRTKAYCKAVIQGDESHSLVKVEYSGGYKDYQEPVWLGLEQYLTLSNQVIFEETWNSKNQEFIKTRLAEKKKGSLLQYEIPIKFPKIIKSIIGEGGPGLRVQGYRRIQFAGKSSWVSGRTSTATSKQSKFPSLDMQQTSSFTIDGNIGSKITVKVDQDSRRLNDLENNIQLRYNGEPEEIIQTIEAGNTNLGVGSATKVGYSQGVQGLFGFKSTARLGGLDLTMIMSQEKGTNSSLQFRAGAESASDSIIRDWEYLRRTFYWLGRFKGLGHSVNDFSSGDSIVVIEVYVSEKDNPYQQGQDTLLTGIAVVEPPDPPIPIDTLSPEWRRNEKGTGKFRRLIRDQDYTISPHQYWIKLKQQLRSNDVLAVYMEIKKAGGTIDTVGSLAYGPYNREGYAYLLKLIKMESPAYFWTDPTDNIFKPYDTWEYEWKNVYDLRVRDIDPGAFRMDIYRGTTGAENIQFDPNNQDSVPYIKILGLDQFDLGGASIPDNKVDIARIDPKSGYLFFPEVRPFASDSSYSGDPADSLQPKVDSIYYSIDQRRLQESSIYYIYFQTSQRSTTYSLGRQNILEGSEVVKLNGRILTRNVDYSINYEFGEISFLAEEARDPNADLTVDFQSVDFIQAQKKSLYGIQAEKPFGKNFRMGFTTIYKSVKPTDDRPRIGNEPNRTVVWDLNLSGNFKPQLLTKLADALPMVSTDVPSELTLKGEVAQSLSNPNIRNKIYMDDFEGVVSFTDLGIRRSNWTLSSSPPNLDGSQKRGKLIWYNPYDQIPVEQIWPNRQVARSQERVNVLSLKFLPDYTAILPHHSWGGIMRSVLQVDQNRSKYLEVWVQVNKGANNPVLHVDLGYISEDVDGDGLLDTEDSLRGAGRNQILDEGEDVGLDGVPDALEPGSDTLNDPNGDNWDYSSNNPNEVSKINGTENNGNDPDRGKIPDTEDLDLSYSLDTYNAYFSFAIDLDDTTYYVSGTESNYGWRLYRIPVRDTSAYTAVNNPDWTHIEYARLRIDGVFDTTIISIAEIRLVSNRWETLPADSIYTGEFFDVTTKSTYDNPDYVPPPGIAGKYDPDQNIRETEQSLALVYEDIQPLRAHYAYRTFYRAEDYTFYGKIKMFVHGPDNPGKVRFFYRVGTDSSSFYEYHTEIYPDWDERNWVDLDFEKATALKIAFEDSILKDTSLKELVQGNYLVKGKRGLLPSFHQVRWLAVGIENLDSLQIVSGEIWVDEMTSTDVRKKPGLAWDGSMGLVLADVLRVNANYSYQDTEFHNLQSNKGSGTTTNFYQINGALQAHKFLPSGWEINLPINFNYSHRLNIPRLRSGSDVILPSDLRNEQRSEETRKGYSIAPRFAKNTKNKLYNLTLKRVSFSYTRTMLDSYRINQPVNKQSGYTTAFGYNASPGKQWTIPFLKWADGLGLPKGIAGTQFGFFPRTLNFGGSIAGSKSHSVTNTGVETNTFTRGFQGGVDAQLDLIKGLPLSYRLSSTRDLRDKGTIIFSLNPKKAKFGIETNMSEDFRANYSPNWFKFMTQSFNYSAGYRENADPKQNIGGYRTVSNSSNIGISGSFNLAYFYNKLFPPAKPAPANPADTTKPEKTKKKPNPFTFLVKEIFTLPKNIDAPSYSYSTDRNFNRSGLLGRPSLWYRLGFETDPQVPVVSDVDPSKTYASGSTQNDRFGLKSGLLLFKAVKTNFGYSYAKGISQGTGDARFRKATTYPEFSLQWGKVKLPIGFNRFFYSVSYQLRYEHGEGEEGNQRTRVLEKRTISDAFAPLAGIALSWKNGVTSSIRYDKSTQESNDLQSKITSITSSRGIAVTSNYSFSSPKGISIPLFGKLKFQSNMNLALEISWRSNERKSATEGQAFTTSQSSSEFSVSPRGSYNFSSQINGGFQARWSDRNDKQTNTKTHFRELGLWVEVKF